MARIRKWQERLLIACAALLFSVTSAWPLGARDATSHEHSTYSRPLTGMSGKTAFGVELAARRPYVRFFRTSLVPVAMPLAAGAFVAMAGAAGAPAAGNPPAGSTCSSCNASTATCCTVAGGNPCCDHHCSRSCTETLTESTYSAGTRECIICRYNFGTQTTHDCKTY